MPLATAWMVYSAPQREEARVVRLIRHFYVLLLGLAPLAQAQVVVNYPDFSSVGGLTLLGTAAQDTNRLRLTQSGAANTWSMAWYTSKLAVGQGFETEFQFRITNPTAGGADGFAFVIQDTSTSLVLADPYYPQGGWLGYVGIIRSLAVEFDTWKNTPDLGDPNDDHVSVQTRSGPSGNTANHGNSLGSTTAVPNMSDGAVHTVRIRYLPGTLTVFMDNMTTPILTVAVDLNTRLGLTGGNAWVGFTAATGSASQKAFILNWSVALGSYAGGTVTTATWHKANSPYHVTSAVTVPAGNTLTIEPGVDVQFDADVQFVVQGRLQAIGTEADSIRFVPGTSPQWRGLRLRGGDSSTVAYARVSGGNARAGTLGDDNGGGVYAKDAGTRVRLDHVVVSGNQAAANGGGVYVDVSAAVRLSSCWVRNNSGVLGGGLHSNGGLLELTRCVLSGNHANNGGGGLYVPFAGGPYTLANCTLYGNSSLGSGGGGALFQSAVIATIRNSIFWANTPNQIVNNGQASVTYSDVQGGGAGTGDIDADPLFLNAAAGDYRLAAGSPCIDAGDPNDPLDPDGTRADMGALAFDYRVQVPPVWSPLADTSAAEGQKLILTVYATDLNAVAGQTLSYDAPTMPAGATFSPDSLRFTWTPGYDQSGEAVVIFSVTDGIATVLDTVHIAVANTNRPPVGTTPDQNGSEDVLLTFAVTATDPDEATDGQRLSYAAIEMPSGAEFDTTGHVFSWRPEFGQMGPHEALFRITDGEAIALDTVAITVGKTNRPPVWAARADTTARATKRLTFTVAASDPDEQALAYQAVELPLWATFDTTSCAFAWTPTYEQRSDAVVVFRVTDGEAAAFDTVVIHVMILYGDASKDGTVSAYDAALILRHAVDLPPPVDLPEGIDSVAADVTGNGVVSAYDASHVLWKVTHPEYEFPVEGGMLSKPIATGPRVLSWVRDGAAWLLVADDATGIEAGDFVLALPAGISAHAGGTEYIASSQEGSVLRVAFARIEAGEPVLFRIEGDAPMERAPEVRGAVLNEGGIPVEQVLRPTEFALSQNAPNPFNPQTTIRFELPEAAHARLAIYTTAGQLVRTLVDGEVAAGPHEVAWDGRDASGREASSGVYVYRLEHVPMSTHVGAALVRRMTLVR